MTASSQDRFVVGVDFGTLSGRAVVVRTSDGAEVGTALHEYAHGVMDETLPDDAAATRLGAARARGLPRRAAHRGA
jgi:L-ribulokinase